MVEITIEPFERNGKPCFIAVAVVDGIRVTEELPLGFETWTKEELKAYFERFTAKSLKTKMLKAQKAIAEGIIEATATDLDRARIKKAQEKRERKRCKNTKTLKSLS